MFVDRGQELAIVDGKMVPRDLDFIDIYLERDDIAMLADPDRRYTTDGFMGCTHNGTIGGWAPEDKLHVRLELPRAPDDEGKLVELSLDPGGDLYFTIWDAQPLRHADEHEVFSVEVPFVTSDPNEKLRHVGIQTIRIHQLNDLADAIAT